MVMHVIEKRRSIRRFLSKQVEPEKIDALVEAAVRAPSSRGLNPWRFIVVTDRDLLGRLSRAKEHGSAFLKNAPVGIVVCGDPDESDVWIEDCSIASIFIVLAAESMDLGSCWIQIRQRMHKKVKTSEEYVSEILNIPQKIKVESIIAVGYPAEKKTPHMKEELQYEKVYRGVYGRL